MIKHVAALGLASLGVLFSHFTYAVGNQLVFGLGYNYLSYDIVGQVNEFTNLASLNLQAKRNNVNLHAAMVSLGYKIERQGSYLTPELSFGKGIKKDRISASGSYAPLFGSTQQINTETEFELQKIISFALQSGFDFTDSFSGFVLSSYSHINVQKKITGLTLNTAAKSDESISLFGFGVGGAYKMSDAILLQASYEFKGNESIIAALHVYF